MELQEVVLDKEVFHEELRTLKMRVAKLEEQNLEKPEILSGTRPWFMPRIIKPRSLEYNSRILKDVTRDFTSTEKIWQKNLRRQA